LVTEKKFNPYYYLLAQRLTAYQPQSYKYTLKYTLWDHLKTIDRFQVRQIANLAKFFGSLMASSDIPLHFLKVIDFDDLQGDKAKPTMVFLHLLLDQIFEESEETLSVVFAKGLPDISGNQRQLMYDSDSDDFLGTKAAAKRENKGKKTVTEDNSEQLKEFIKGFSNFVLTKFYNRVKDNKQIQTKLKAVFAVLSKRKRKNII
jgi:hypothetical protein